MKKVFHGTQPSSLLVHPLEETESLHKVIDQLVSLLTNMGDLDVLLYKEATAVELTEFLTTAMALKDSFPVMPYQVCQMDRLIGSTSKGKAYSIWLVRTSHKPLRESGSPLYRMVPLRLPGENSEGVLFPEPEIKYPMIVVQYAMGWESRLLYVVDLKREHAAIYPGSDAAHSKFLYVEADFDTASKFVTSFGRYPHFALLPLR